jgi:RNA polymerase sigma-32 factor
MTSNLILREDNNLYQYIAEINKFPLLTEEEEKFHYKEISDGNLNSAKLLVSSHLRLVVKIANGYRNYGLPMMDLIGEGNLGLMRAVKTFDYKKGYKLATYSMWWIKAYIQEYILKMWSIVKIGTSSTQKKLFFNLKKVKSFILNYTNNKYLTDEETEKISKMFNVNVNDVVEMDRRLSKGDVFLNTKCGDEEEIEKIDLIPNRQALQDVVVDNKRERKKNMKLLQLAISKLNDREKEVIKLRCLIDDPLTLKEVSKKCGVSSERIRQIETKAIDKIRDFMLGNNIGI